MDQKWILMILVFYQKMTSGAGEDITSQEGKPVDIKCKPSVVGTMVVWFRVLDTSDIEFIGSYTNNGIQKSTVSSPSFSYSKIHLNIVTLQSFNKGRDSGTYTCASLKSNDLHFGEVTRLVGEKAEIATKAPPTITTTTTTKQNQSTTTACDCTAISKKGLTALETSLPTFCSPFILGPLAGSCGLLLLLLIIVSVYCNRIRTRRCPHHYKRKLRMVAPGKQVMANRPV